MSVHVTRHPETGLWWIWNHDRQSITLTDTELLDVVRQISGRLEDVPS